MPWCKREAYWGEYVLYCLHKGGGERSVRSLSCLQNGYMGGELRMTLLLGSRWSSVTAKRGRVLCPFLQRDRRSAAA